jgi:catalase
MQWDLMVAQDTDFHLRDLSSPSRVGSSSTSRRCRWLSETDQENLVANIVGHASAKEVTPEMKVRVVEYWANVHHDLGAGVAKGLDVS